MAGRTDGAPAPVIQLPRSGQDGNEFGHSSPMLGPNSGMIDARGVVLTDPCIAITDAGARDGSI
jgi:hypothetical protein